MVQRFEPDWEAVFKRDYCEICKNRSYCPYDWKCQDIELFIKENEESHENIHVDNSKNSA